MISVALPYIALPALGFGAVGVGAGTVAAGLHMFLWRGIRDVLQRSNHG